ncbi:MAG TPA: erythromycin esterase family protein [Mycobacteriales bacterium]|nr:erythromycin esterase family protein [Mycobacteriales bacterium]
MRTGMVLLVGAVTALVPVAVSAAGPDPVTAWVSRTADPLRTVDPAAPLDDLGPLRRSIGGATIVGLGESAHLASEELDLKHRVLRLLVERMGFRSIAWEEQWTAGLQVDRCIRTGKGDLTHLMGQLSPQWNNAEVADTLRWLRDYNATHRDQVRFTGIEFFLIPRSSYVSLESYVARAAPDRLPALRADLREIRPPKGMDMYQYAASLQQIPSKVRHARAVRALVAGIPGADPLMVHTAEQIVLFYQHYNRPEAAQPRFRDAHSARNLRWWRDYTGDRIALWAASAHTAVAPRLRLSNPAGSDLRFASAGSYLRRWYGAGYRSIGFTFDHGSVGGVPQPAPERGWFERPFGAVDLAQFSLDLRRPAPRAVRCWLHRPARTRGLFGAGSVTDGGTLRQWFDVLVHRQVVTSARPA